MNDLQYLRSIVDDIVAVWSAHSSVKAVASVGSVAIGEVDTLSDTDTICYCDELPPEEDVIRLRDEVMDTWGNWYWKSPEFGYGMYFFVNGVKCDIGFHPMSQQEQLMDDVLNDLDLDAGKQKMMSGMVNTVPLYGEDIIIKWRDRARNDYPEALAEKIVNEYLKFRPLWVARDMAAGRNDLVWYYNELTSMQHNLLSVLVGLNHMYHPMDFKHMDFIIGQMQHKPQNLADRLRESFRIDAVESAIKMGDLIEETFDLIAVHMPSIDIEPKRDWLRTDIQRWQQPK